MVQDRFLARLNRHQINTMLKRTRDGSVEDQNGKVIFFSFDRFMADIVEGNSCFICGKSPSAVPFNDEHVLPDWILKRYGLYDRVIHIPNKTEFSYRHLKTPCCVECNSVMGRLFEQPLKRLFLNGFDEFKKHFASSGLPMLFVWMTLIFLKTHLKDKNLRFHRDLRKEDLKIGQIYSWEDLHHIHCVCRSFYTGCELDITAGGSLLVLPAKRSSGFESFDYLDLHLAQTMLLRIEDIALIVSLDDGRSGVQFLKHILERFSAPLSPIQLRELAVRLASLNIHLSKRPRFFSDIDLLSGKCKILGELPPLWSWAELDDASFGEMFYFATRNMLSFVEDPTIIENVKNGKWTFLFDKDGTFLANSMDRILGTEGSTS